MKLLGLRISDHLPSNIEMTFPSNITTKSDSRLAKTVSICKSVQPLRSWILSSIRKVCWSTRIRAIGTLCDIADAAMGAAYRGTLRDGERFTTLELKINFLRPVWKAKLRAEAKIVRAGKVVGLVECDIIDDKKRLVARASGTCITLRGEPAAGC
jgi:Thioesterase superfamily